MKCKRCGLCCSDVGRTFWKAGFIDDPPFGGDKQLLAEAKNGDHEDGGLACEKLVFKRGKPFCTIYDNRPSVCREYPDGDLCRREEQAAEKFLADANGSLI